MRLSPDEFENTSTHAECPWYFLISLTLSTCRIIIYLKEKESATRQTKLLLFKNKNLFKI